MIPKYEQIKPYIEKKLVSEQAHPENANVRIFNYTQHCQFEGAWDDITEQCRGLILNILTGEVIARPFRKFFNYGQHIEQGKPIPECKPVISEKFDGSLGILYILNGKAWIATRGSFTSEQAIWATNWFRKNVEQSEFIEPGITNLFEIIYPKNRIVVNYDFSGLVHIGSLENQNGLPVDVYWREEIFRKPKIIEATDLKELEKMDTPSSEGFVVYFPETDLRLKIKFAEYVRLHKLITGVSEIAIWEHLKDGKNLKDLLEKVPDEFFKWVTDVEYKLMKAFAEIETRCKNDFLAINHAGRSRKEVALSFQECKYPSILFAILDDKDYKQIIWKMIRPKGQSVFKPDTDL